MGQLNENDNNKNRKYKTIDARVKETYSKDSAATNRNSLSDVYVKFFRWASDRLDGRDGIVCFVSNNSFVDQIAFDGMRKHLLKDFTYVDHLDLHGNVRKNPKLSGTTHNIFGIQVGVGITFAVRRKGKPKALRYFRVPEFDTKEEKLQFLQKSVTASSVPWQVLTPDSKQNWLILDNADEFEKFMPINEIFELHSIGVKTNRDDWVYDFDRRSLQNRIERFVETYNSELDRYRRTTPKPSNLDDFVLADEGRIKWSRDLKLDLTRGHYCEFSPDKIVESTYRPFCRKLLYFDRILNEEIYQQSLIFPGAAKNVAICCTIDSQIEFSALAVNIVPNHGLGQRPGQNFPLWIYEQGDPTPRDNIRDTAVEAFKAHYKTSVITKSQIFHYIYALLHHPGYRAKYAENLKKELPRIPFAPDFMAFSKIGAQLAELHLKYETLDPAPLDEIVNTLHPRSYRVDSAMRYTNKEKTAIQLNDYLTLAGIPIEAHEYRIGSRSALDWVVEMYRITEDKRSGIRQDPNRLDQPDYIVNLIGRVARVSIETVKLTKSLGLLPFSK